MIQEYRCGRCKHLLFKGNLKLLLTEQHDPDTDLHRAEVSELCIAEPVCLSPWRGCHQVASHQNICATIYHLQLGSLEGE